MVKVIHWKNMLVNWKSNKLCLQKDQVVEYIWMVRKVVSLIKMLNKLRTQTLLIFTQLQTKPYQNQKKILVSMKLLKILCKALSINLIQNRNVAFIWCWIEYNIMKLLQFLSFQRLTMNIVLMNREETLPLLVDMDNSLKK